MICIIGGSGFIGTRFAHRLSGSGKAFSILDIVDSPQFADHRRYADVTSLPSLLAAIPSGTTAIVNLAAQHADNVRPIRLYDEVNVLGAENVCKAAEQIGVRTVVFTSSVAVYGHAPPDTDESGKIAYANDYGRTKWLAENVYRTWHAASPTIRRLAIVRPTVVFGEGNRANVYSLFKQVSTPRYFMIGTGENVKSLAYVENVSAFLEHLVDGEPGIFLSNYVDKPDLSVAQIIHSARSALGLPIEPAFRIGRRTGAAVGAFADLVGLVSGRSLPIGRLRVQKFCATTQYSTRMATFGFHPPVDLIDAIGRTVAAEFGKLR